MQSSQSNENSIVNTRVYLTYSKYIQVCYLASFLKKHLIEIQIYLLLLEGITY